MSPSPTIALLILSYNHPEITAKAVESARAFTFPVFLIHNGSEPKHRETLIQKFPDVKHLVLETNRGYTGGLNFGLSQVFPDYEWIFVLTNDCVLAQLSVPANTPPGLIAPSIFFRSLARVDSLGGWFIPKAAKLGHCKSLDEFSTLKNSNKKSYVPGTAFFLHRDVFNKVGTFDESLGTYWEDVDFSLRTELHQFPVLVTTDTKVIHSVGKTCHKHKHYTTYLFQRNRKRISRKYTPWYLRPYLELVLFASWVQLSVRMLKNNRQDSLVLLLKAIRD